MNFTTNTLLSKAAWATPAYFGYYLLVTIIIGTFFVFIVHTYDRITPFVHPIAYSTYVHRRTFNSSITHNSASLFALLKSPYRLGTKYTSRNYPSACTRLVLCVLGFPIISNCCFKCRFLHRLCTSHSIAGHFSLESSLVYALPTSSCTYADNLGKNAPFPLLHVSLRIHYELSCRKKGIYLSPHSSSANTSSQVFFERRSLISSGP